MLFASDSEAHRVYTIAINLYWCDYMTNPDALWVEVAATIK